MVDSLDVGGAERHVIGLATALVSEGHAVTLACSVNGALASSAEAAGVTIRPLLGRLVKRRLSLPFAWQLAGLVRREPFDLVHAHIYASEVASALATLGTRVPLVLTAHTEADWQGRRARWLNRYAYRRASHVVAVSDNIGRQLIERDGVPPDQVTTIPNALPPLPMTLPTPTLLFEKNGHAGPVIGVVARLQPEKGVEYFLRAAAEVARSATGARFVVIGDGPLRRELEALAEQLGLGERVRFLGLRPDAPTLVAGFDLLAVPSLSEGTALRVLEAMAAGVPIVASAVGGIPDQIRHEREGLLVPPGDPAALATAILSLTRDPLRARCLGEAGRRRLVSCFGYDVMLRRILAIYHAALEWPESFAPVPRLPASSPSP